METEKQTCGWFVFNSGQVLIEKKEDGYHIPYGPEPPVEVPVGSTIHTIGEINGYPAKTYAIHIPVSGDENSPRMMKDLRASFDVLPLEEYKRAGKASQILNWDKNSRYCPMCGVPTVQVSPIAKRCPECRQEFYPRISPAVIVLIKKEDSILLVHARNFRGTFKGLVAGFLEPGETLEECVHREVMEETGLTIKPEIFRQSTVALPQRNYGRILCRIRKRNHQASGRRTECRSLLQPKQPAGNSEKAQHRPPTD